MRPAAPRRQARHLHRCRRRHRHGPHHPLPRPRPARRHRRPPARAASSGTLAGITDEIALLRTALDALADRDRRHEDQIRKLAGHTN
ncbi:MAG TPA: hypothetical protein VN961_04195 [Streptosporangiaceae bacterium]|nr:hypothetical protein [Streptosporangiaceae bacterium]